MKSGSYWDRFWDDVLEELRRRAVQHVVDNIDSPKNQEYVENLLKLVREWKNAPIIRIAGYIASVCQDCLEPSVQTLYYYLDPAISEHFRDLSVHRCSKENLNRAKHVNKTKETEIAWKIAEEDLIAAVTKWGKKEKLLFSYPCNAKEDGFVDLGKVEEGGWAWGATKGNKRLEEEEVNDFLRRSHATEGIFRLSLNGENRFFKMLLVAEYEVGTSKKDTTAHEQRINGESTKASGIMDNPFREKGAVLDDLQDFIARCSSIVEPEHPRKDTQSDDKG